MIGVLPEIVEWYVDIARDCHQILWCHFTHESFGDHSNLIK